MKRLLILLCTLLLAACLSSSDDNDATGPPGSNRANQWVRNNAMFVAGLNVSMGNPPASFVNNYYGGFGANAVHLWADGLPYEMQAWRSHSGGGFRWISWVAANGRSPANGYIIGNVGADPVGRIGYQVDDEPAGNCQNEACALNNLQRIKNGINLVRQADPNGLIIVNFKRSGLLSTLLNNYCNSGLGDIIGYSHYPRSYSAYRYLEIVRRASVDYDMPVFAYLKAFRDQIDQESINGSDMRWNAFSALLYGFKGISWFVYSIKPNGEIDPALFTSEGSFSASPSGAWSAAASLNRQVRQLGRTMSQLYSTAVRFVPAFNYLQPGGTTRWYKGSGDDRYITKIESSDSGNPFDISVGYFKDNAGEIYFMIQNVSHSGWLGESPITYGGSGPVRVNFDFSQAPEGTSRNTILMLDKNSGQTRTISLSDANGQTASMVMNFNEGDAQLFKYNTGRGFARR
jgi:hypothetical protein